ncbi:MAG: DNA-binding response regulator [Paenibacillaceae bacterium]|jgi:DNA-binding NarL/FixJ family response regulator|nr:DNA-binding response regulator [Paenibacillaceae bacterium]
MCRPIRVLLVEDDPDFRMLMRGMIRETSDLELAGEACCKEEAVSCAAALQPDIVLMDLKLSSADMDGIPAAKQIRLDTRAKVIIVTGFEDRDITLEACKKSFASGYIYKSQRLLLVPTIRQTAAGLTPTEIFIQSLMLAELSTAERTVFHFMTGAPVQLISSEKTIANQKTSIFRKLGVKNSQELIHLFGSSS